MYDSNFYRRNLPHWQPPHAEYFVTFRLKGSLPKSVIKQLKEAQELFDEEYSESDKINLMAKKGYAEIFKKYEKLLDASKSGPTWLAIPKIARIIQEALLHRDQNEYDLYAFCIMSNHVHIIFKLLDAFEESIKFPVTEIFKKLKSFTALKANQKLGRTGSFWHAESYDRVIRDEDELENTIRYVLNNPVKAGLVKNWKEWEHTYCKPEFLQSLI
jgi:REP element-mobilizing transposase RayT